MNIFSIKAKIVILTVLVIALHIILACADRIEDYEAFVCTLGYIAIATLIISMLPDSDDIKERK